MAEQWKSTPNYWCKFCKTYVRDTKSERAKHEATGRHKGAIDRHLRGIQKEEDKKEREQNRLDNEIARVKKLAGHRVDRPDTSSPTQSQMKRQEEPRRQTTQQVSIRERIRQAESAAALGIAIPEELRPHMSLAGSWQRIETRPPVKEEVKKEDIKQEADANQEDGVTPDSRKRPADAEEEEAKPRKRGPHIYATEAAKEKAGKEIESLFASFGVKKEESVEDEEKPLAESVVKAPIKFKKRARPTATMINRDSGKETAAE